MDILTHIRGLPTLEQRTAAVAKVQAIERDAMIKQTPQPGLVPLMDYLHSKGMKRALCTRNFEYVFLPLSHLNGSCHVAGKRSLLMLSWVEEHR